jgi:serine/threonine-protein kinase
VLLNNRYELQRELGRGGMGAVFAARDTVLDAPVAIKVLLGERPGPDIAKRFLQEARAAAQVRHANIVSVLDFGFDEANGALFLVQEFLVGRDLKHQIQSAGPFSPKQAIELLVPVMRALAFAHSKGVVHRDLKPDNIFLCETPDGIVPKVIDFGIAKMTDEQGQSAQHTRTSQVLGTPYFMSPEQARGDRAVDHRADIWSLGVVLFFALTQRYPHEGASVNLIITNIIARQPTPINAYAPTLPQPVVELVHRALQYEAEQRYASMDEFTQAARNCLAALGSTFAAPLSMTVAASPPSWMQPPADVYTVAPQVMATTPLGAAEPKRSASWLILAAAALAMGAGVVGYVSTRPSAASRRITTAVLTQPRPTVIAPAAALALRPAAPVTPVAPAPTPVPDTAALAVPASAPIPSPAQVRHMSPPVTRARPRGHASPHDALAPAHAATPSTNVAPSAYY